MTLRHYFTTHEVARLAHVSPSTVLNWIDRGLLPAHRTPGGHRRVQRDQLIEFLRSHSMPLPAQLSEVHKLLIVDGDASTLRSALEALKQCAPQVEVEGFANPIDGLLACGASPPDVLLLDAALGHVDALEACRRLSGGWDHPVRVIVTSRSPSDSQRAAYLRAGAQGYLSSPIDPKELLRLLGLMEDISARQ